MRQAKDSDAAVAIAYSDASRISQDTYNQDIGCYDHEGQAFNYSIFARSITIVLRIPIYNSGLKLLTTNEEFYRQVHRGCETILKAMKTTEVTA